MQGGKYEKRKPWHNIAGRGLENAAQASMDSQKNTFNTP